MFGEKAESDLNTLIDRIWQGVKAVGPEMLASLLLLAFGLFSAFVMKRASLFAIERLRQSRLGGFTHRLDTRVLDGMAIGMSRLIFWLTIFVFVILTAQIFDVNVLDEWFRMSAGFVPSLLGAVVILLTGLFLSMFTREFLRRSAATLGIPNADGLAALIYSVGVVVTLLMTTNQLGINVEFLTSAMLVGIGALLLGGALSFGIGSAPVVSNILATHFVRKNLKVGQNVLYGDCHGRVIDINASGIVVMTKKGKRLIPGRQLNDQGFEVISGGD